MKNFIAIILTILPLSCTALSCVGALAFTIMYPICIIYLLGSCLGFIILLDNVSNIYDSIKDLLNTLS